jgi:threonine/homoserine/homoserine lactone efflux protein
MIGEMALDFLLKGILLGFSIAAPVGPIGVLCIRRSLSQGRAAGLACGLGAATADAIYGALAGFGLTALTGRLLEGQLALRLGGGAFLLILGVRTFLAPPAEQAAAAGGAGLASLYLSTLLLTLSNPLTILSFTAVFAGVGIGLTPGAGLAALLLVAGVFLGSAAWWLLLSSGVSRLGRRFAAGWMSWVNRLSGAILFAFGAAALLSLL